MYFHFHAAHLTIKYSVHQDTRPSGWAAECASVVICITVSQYMQLSAHFVFGLLVIQWYSCRGVGGKWPRNIRQSAPLLFTQGPNLCGTKISGHKWSSAAASHALPRLLHETVEKWGFQHSQANNDKNWTALLDWRGKSFCARALVSTLSSPRLILY